MSAGWRPAATHAALQLRARMLDLARNFFRARGVLEVETPLAVSATVTDVQIESLRLDGDPPRYLHTSPEYAMKRLLAAGSGDIFQVCKVFRGGERSRLHNPEFTLIEWYRLGMDLDGVMEETAALAGELLAPLGRSLELEKIGYAEAFQRELGCDPLEASHGELAALAQSRGLAAASIDSATRDDLLDFLVATVIGPGLGRGKLTCLHHYPASQAALAQLDAGDPRTALRFELYANGVELANGFVELGSAAEQRARFEADRAERARRGLPQPAIDESLLGALDAGLPACAGVAMGFDRVAMLAMGAHDIDAVLAFPWERS